jgi:Protein of unknown function (DUF3102)
MENATPVAAAQAANSTTDIAGSNSLADLAARINAEHTEVVHALAAGLVHAITAGKLLIEAKDKLDHGQWLPWIRENCLISARTASRYMRLARHAPDLESKSANVADLTVEQAFTLISKATDPDNPEVPPQGSTWDEVCAWARDQLDCAFNDWDFRFGDEDKYTGQWIRTKLIHQLRLPPIFGWCYLTPCDLGDEDLRLKLMRLCPWDDLWEAVEKIAPVVSKTSKRPYPTRFHLTDHKRALPVGFVIIEMEAMRMLGTAIHEIEYREKISEERYAKEFDETHQQVMARLEEKIAEVEAAVS